MGYAVTCIVIMLLLILIFKKCEVGTKHLVLEIVANNLNIYFNHLLKKYFISNSNNFSEFQLRIMQLISKFNFNNLNVLSINNLNKETAYTLNKKLLYICLENKVYPYKIYNINTIMFVVIHELTHMSNNTWNHDLKFWKLFKSYIIEAINAEIYQPINYKNNPEHYCNTTINYNPYYDSAIIAFE